MIRAGAMASESVADAVACVGLVESVTVTTTELDPADAGVPDIWPLLLMLKPEGSPLADQVYGALPPVAATVVEYAAPAAPFGSDAVVTEGAAAIAIEVESVTVIGAVLVPCVVGSTNETTADRVSHFKE